jgi:Rieske Fe-S protein
MTTHSHRERHRDAGRPEGREDLRPDRRTVLRGVAATGALGASASLLAACGGSSGEPESGSGSGSATGKGAAAGGMLGPASEVPVGGGMIYKEQEVVVTQPSKGDLQAFSSTCTHQGCPVGEVAGGTINCPCHGSKFNLDGTVANGPATRPLPKKQIEVKSGQIRLA